MVTLCRKHKKAYIPPSWLKEDEAKALSHRLGLPIVMP